MVFMSIPFWLRDGKYFAGMLFDLGFVLDFYRDTGLFVT